MCKIIVVANQKGGVAKTSTVRNLSYSLAELGKRVLTVDFDAQFNLTTCFGIENPNELQHTVATLMTSMLNDEEIPMKEEYVITVGKVDLIPSSIQLSVVDANLRLEMGSDRLLANLLETLKPDYDYIIVDTCPSLGTLTINALTAADEVIIPVNLSSAEQQMIEETLSENEYKVDMKKAELLRSYAGRLTPELTEEILSGEKMKKPKSDKPQPFKLKASIYTKYFAPGTRAKDMEQIIDEALALYFKDAEDNPSA